jgi:hypothetical protein
VKVDEETSSLTVVRDIGQNISSSAHNSPTSAFSERDSGLSAEQRDGVA